MQDGGKAKFCLFYQLHFWYVSLVEWLFELGEGLTRLNDRINRTRVGVWGCWGENCRLWDTKYEAASRGEWERRGKKKIRRGGEYARKERKNKAGESIILKGRGERGEEQLSKKKKPRGRQAEDEGCGGGEGGGDGGGEQDQKALWVLQDPEV